MSSFFTLFVMLFMVLMFITLGLAGMDSYLDRSNTLGFVSALGLNLTFSLLSMLFIIIAMVISFSIDFFDGDTKNTLFAFSLALVGMAFLKYALLAYYAVVLTFPLLLIFLNLILMMIPPYILYKALEEYGKGFMH